MRHILLRIIYLDTYSSELYVASLRRKGISIGEGTIFFDPRNIVVDTQNPKLIRIGHNVRITSGCKILTHDFSSSVIGGLYGQCIGALGTVEIGNNVFIGMNSVILRNSSIGDNVVIGAGSVVCGTIESNSVYAGNPARKIMSIEDFYQKRIDKREFEIKTVINKINSKSSKEIWHYLREYSCDFVDAPIELKERQMKDTGYYEKCDKYYSTHKAEYSLNDFMDKV